MHITTVCQVAYVPFVASWTDWLEHPINDVIHSPPQFNAT